MNCEFFFKQIIENCALLSIIIIKMIKYTYFIIIKIREGNTIIGLMKIIDDS